MLKMSQSFLLQSYVNILTKSIPRAHFQADSATLEKRKLMASTLELYS